MEYFQIMNLQKEPFSNSPEPDFFFQSDQHQACLQKLELALRLRRGLNVVMGEVGTGKTTLCRRLILNLSQTEEDKNSIEAHLILDPHFSNALEFLSAVALLFGISQTRTRKSEWQLKEAIKNHLFSRGVDEKKTVVLIVDEGQKIPDFCLEILREFLNYETNEFKLLQIVIFAQREFEETLRAYSNFADRVNQYYILEPLDFPNCRKMIRYRLEKASADPSAVPDIFTGPSLWAIYRATGGYPRRIIMLCHQVMLAMIIQNRTRAGIFLVRSCAGRIHPRQAIRWPRWALSFAAVGLLIFLLVNNYGKLAVSPSERREAAARPVQDRQPDSAATDSPGTISVKQVALAKDAPAVEQSDIRLAAKQIPETLGQLIVEKNDCVSKMLALLYGRDSINRLRAARLANPQIKDIDQLKIGDIVSIPAQRSRENPLPKGKYWLQLASVASLQDAYTFMKKNVQFAELYLNAYWNSSEGAVYSVLLKEGFSSETAADAFVKTLPPDLAAKVRVISRWPDDTVYL